MPQIEAYSPGALCWADLTTADQQGSKRFYQSLFDWDAFDAPMGEGTYYSQMLLRGKPVVAVAPLPPGQDFGIASWDVYVSVDDADAAVARAQELGASVTGDGAFDVFEFGRMAELTDPQGARFRLWEPGKHIGAEIIREPGSIAWYELATTDLDASSDFYGELFDWEISAIPGVDNYFAASTMNGEGTAGITPTEAGLSGWTVYLWADDVDATLATALENGAKELAGAEDIPGGMGRFALVDDPQGATIGFFKV